jgi:outer membrane lipoprotein-sorting protein
MIRHPRPAGLIAPNRRRLLQAALALPALLAFRGARAEGEPEALPPDAMTPVHERYGALKSYADTGKLTTIYQWPDTPETDSHYRFETAFRAPRNFFFRFDTEADTGDDTFVIWCDGGDFQSWWKATGVHEVYGGGRGANGFYAGGSPTKESVNLLGPHVFPQALLYGPTSRLIDLREAGEEEVAGHACLKFAAAGRQTGVVTNEARPVTVWVDKEATLIRQVRTDAETGSQKDFVDTILYEIEPQADPELPDSRFTFTPPE